MFEGYSKMKNQKVKLTVDTKSWNNEIKLKNWQ